MSLFVFFWVPAIELDLVLAWQLIASFIQPLLEGMAERDYFHIDESNQRRESPKLSIL